MLSLEFRCCTYVYSPDSQGISALSSNGLNFKCSFLIIYLQFILSHQIIFVQYLSLFTVLFNFRFCCLDKTIFCYIEQYLSFSTEKWSDRWIKRGIPKYLMGLWVRKTFGNNEYRDMIHQVRIWKSVNNIHIKLFRKAKQDNFKKIYVLYYICKQNLMIE